MREPHDEVSIMEAARFTGDNVTAAPQPNVSPVKTMVALNKALLYIAYHAWSVVIQPYYPEDFDQISVSYRTRQSFAAVLSEISTNSHPIDRLNLASVQLHELNCRPARALVRPSRCKSDPTMRVPGSGVGQRHVADFHEGLTIMHDPAFDGRRILLTDAKGTISRHANLSES